MMRDIQIIDLEPQTTVHERRPDMKRIAVITAANGEPMDFVIEPGTTAGEILRKLNLDEHFILTSGRGQEAFGNDENLYPRVPDGAKLYASTPVEVGNVNELR